MRALAAALAIALAATAAHANECRAIDNDLDRLACYDRESGRTPKVELRGAGESAWRVRIERSDMTDETNVFLAAESSEEVQCGRFETARLTLWIRCLENTTAFIVAGPRCHFTDHRDYDRVDLRIDDRPAVTRRMTASTDNHAIGLWRGGKSIPVVKSLFGARRLLVRATPFGASPFTAEFDISGLEEAVAPLREACHW